MKKKHGRHPYLSEVSDMLRETDVTIEEVVSNPDHPAVERGVKRVEGAIRTGKVPDEPHGFAPENDVFSYAVARILVSIIGSDGLIDHYVRAEVKRIWKDLDSKVEEYGSSSLYLGNEETMNELYDEFDLTVEEPSGSKLHPEGFDIPVSDYLRLSQDLGREFRLQNRQLDGGVVPVTERELHKLLQKAIAQRIGEDLPLDVPPGVPDLLAEQVDSIEQQVGEWQGDEIITVVNPEAFPDCIDQLYSAARAGELGWAESKHESVALITFFSHLGVEEDEISEYFPTGTSVYETLMRNINEGGLTLPGCDALDELGICDEGRCKEGSHPIAEYRKNLDIIRESERENTGKAAS